MKVLVLLLVPFHFLSGQKMVEKSIVHPEIEAIAIDVANCFELFIDTAPGNEMMLEASLEGEYKNELLLNVETSGNTLLVNTIFQPNFIHPNDKLSAHKVVSVSLKVLLPDYKRVRVFGGGCHVNAQGRYRNLKITLNEGRCLLDQVSGTAGVSTQSGTISVTAESASITAKSKYGEVGNNPIPKGDPHYTLNSVKGDIQLNRIE